ncbi:MAG: hypothetical protein OHK93_001543 [Ramalina farinacea]|uniref:Protein phosphatase 4 core regulatory subunit R2 n=1 Tax=Ramalina farinacea TaxID=258253 RepID=A0AA43QT33_9LECA|nr:hypothetical protein [Ramalina farinacea]
MSVEENSPSEEGPPEKKARLEGHQGHSSPPSSIHKSIEETGSGPESSNPKQETSNPPLTVSTERVTATTPPASLSPPSNTLPPQLVSLLRGIQSTLRTNFPSSPPHTAQRLAELILEPKQHYKTLPSYLRALDRIVSVASPVSDFPLPIITPSWHNENALFNGTSSPDAAELDDKDFIGGAELTPIPWTRHADSSSPPPGGGGLHNGHNTSDLRTESTSVIDGPNGAGSVETVTVSVNGVSSRVPASQAAEEGLQTNVTQGELIRQEQEAGITPIPTGSANNGRITRSLAAASAGSGRTANGVTTSTSADVDEADEGPAAEEEETVHARGPSMIGMEDMGPQAPGSGLERGIGLEGPLGVSREGEPVDGESKDDGDKEERGEDIVVADADGVTEGDMGVSERGEERGGDAVDSTAAS